MNDMFDTVINEHVKVLKKYYIQTYLRKMCEAIIIIS